MINRINPLSTDIVIFIVANIVNLLVVGVFLSRTKGLQDLEYYIGLILIIMALPLITAVIFNIIDKRDWWSIVLPLPLILYCFIELLFDYILNLNFRNTALLWPYLTIFYLGLMGMIGYSFLIGKIYGFITLGTYFINLLATWYSYSKVGHG